MSVIEILVITLSILLVLTIFFFLYLLQYKERVIREKDNEIEKLTRKIHFDSITLDRLRKELSKNSKK